MSLLINQPAHEFKLFNTEKEEIKLSDFRGKNVLLLFFPLAFTGTCTAEMCHMRDTIAEYDNLNATVFAISVDSVFVLKKYKESMNVQFNFLSDFNKTVSEQYGTLYPEFILGMKGVSKRSAFVIDKSGIIRYSEVLEVSGEQPNYTAVKSCLQSLN